MAKKAKMTLKEFKLALESTDSTAYLSANLHDGNWRTLLVFLNNRLYEEYQRMEHEGNELRAGWLKRDWETLRDIIDQYNSPLDEDN